MFATQVLPETFSDDMKESGTEVVGFIVVDNKNHEVKKGETKIGRDSSVCSIVVENSTVSKVHAVIESDGIDDTFIYDVGSTNQTRLGKKVLKPHCRYKLDNESNITLGSVKIKFTIPPDKSSDVKPNNYNLDMYNASNNIEDIFDVATQAVAPQSEALSKVTALEKQSKVFQTSKIPNTKPKESPKISKSVFDFETQCRLYTQKAVTETELGRSSYESFEIFSLSTQCQIYSCEEVKNNNSATTSLNEKGEQLEMLLNDGEDDVLCAVMSLHSPRGTANEGVVKEIKTEVENVSEVLDEPTQVQDNVTECQEEKESESNTSFKDKDFLLTGLPTISSTPLNCKFKSNVSENNSFIKHDEDFIKTQEFKVNELHQRNQSDNLSQDEETQPYLKESLIDPSTTEKCADEDFTLTLSFETSGKEELNKRPSAIIPDSEDFVETQIYDVEEAKKSADSFITEMRLPQSSEPLVDCTQGNNEDDFIATQVFKEPIEAGKGVENSETKTPDDEDFIATQIVQLSTTARLKNATDPQETRMKRASQESSPDLLANGSPCMDSEDCVGTQLFEPIKNDNFKTVFFGLSEKFHSFFSSSHEKNDSRTVRTESNAIAESSGDETESDLEILLEKNETNGKDNRITRICHSEDDFIATQIFQEPNEARKDAGDPETSSSKRLRTYEDFVTTQVVELSTTPLLKKVDFESLQNPRRPRSSTSEDSNDSYVFELQSENNSEKIQADKNQGPDSSDSDATDCDEISILNSNIVIKQEPVKQTQFEDTQVLTLTPPENLMESSDDYSKGGESPKFEMGNENESWSPLSLEMPGTQDMETSVKSMSRNKREGTGRIASEKCEDQSASSEIQKTEVGIKSSNGSGSFWKTEHSEKKVHSPKKRPRDDNDTQEVPIKKSKTDSFLKNSEKQFSKLVQAHDIAQIQPGRTRNSMKNFKPEINTDDSSENNINIVRPTSRRKVNPKRGNSKSLNSDITPYLIKRPSRGEQSKETSLCEKDSNANEGTTRVLRSSKRNTLSPNNVFKSSERVVSNKMSRKNCRQRKNENLSSYCIYIAFTGFDCPSLDKIISDLGGKKINDLSGSEVVVADKVRRTVKFLCAIGLGLPISSPQWLLTCKKEKKFLNPWNFILKDEEAENKWDFDLKTSLERSKKVKLFQGFSVFATTSTKPPVRDLLAIVECCGGTPLFEPPKIWPKKTIIVSCPEDTKFWPPAKLRNVQIVHYEFVLSGVLRQKADFKAYKLR